MSEPNMGLVVLGPVLGPADNAISHVSNHAVHLITKGRKSEPKSKKRRIASHGGGKE